MKDADVVVHFAAESHVDRSIEDPTVFVRTNITGTLVLLEAAKNNGNVLSVSQIFFFCIRSFVHHAKNKTGRKISKNKIAPPATSKRKNCPKRVDNNAAKIP